MSLPIETNTRPSPRRVLLSAGSDIGGYVPRPQDLGGRGKIRDVTIAFRCFAALLGIVVTACGPVDVPAHVDWEGRTYIPVSICLDRSDVTDRALSVSASWEPGSVPARPIVGIRVEQAIAVDTEEWSRCRSHGWVTAVADELNALAAQGRPTLRL
jgi:hypothetical protein